MNVLIDDSDYELFAGTNWHISDTGYVVWRGILGGIKRTVRLHRVITGAGDGDVVDHINRDKLDNRKENLRFVSFSENAKNCDRYDNAKGYYFDNRKKRWTVDFKRFGVRSVYMDTEESCIEYVESLKSGVDPKRVFTKVVWRGASKLTPEQREYAISESRTRTKRSIANELGVSESCIGRLVNGRTWRVNL